MIKHLSKISGVAAFAVIASSASAEVAINENLSLDGYATSAAVVTEPSAGTSKVLNDSGRPYDSAKIAVNGKYEAFTSKVSLLALTGADTGASDSSGLLDAYVTYKTGDVSITGGKFLSYLGYESFDTPNNAFISYGSSDYFGNYGTGAKIDYTTKTYSTGFSVRDSIDGSGNFQEGDGDFSDELGYEAYFLYSGIEKLTVFLGAGYEDTKGGAEIQTYNVWASYAITDKLTLAAEYANKKDITSYSWLTQASYAVNDSVSVAARLTGKDSSGTDASTTPPSQRGEAFGYGLASTYTLSKNFAIKGEVTKFENNTSADTFSYAVQGLFKF
jgi:hypothetical protein